MKKSHFLGPGLSSAETLAGIIYLAVQLFVLPSVLHWFNRTMGGPLSEAELNFLFYFINFMAMLLIFQNFLSSSLRQALQHPILLCEAVILGLVGYYACMYCTEWIIDLLSPGYSNYNDEAIFAMSRSNSFLLFIGTVILVPPFEECMYRGLVFRNLYGKNKWAAYAVSILLFAIIHILGYLGKYAPLELLMAVLQYLPAGLCLAWAYTQSGNIFAPIMIHTVINAMGVAAMR